jgi:NADPH-dependent 2,4-dienoyl-CoA reductase/sulfur reductase-like enzyme
MVGHSSPRWSHRRLFSCRPAASLASVTTPSIGTPLVRLAQVRRTKEKGSHHVYNYRNHRARRRRGVDEVRDEVDAIVVGSGINGLVAAAELARSGWSVVLLERNAKIGGFIATEERTLPGYLHDTFSSWHPLFVSGPAYSSLGELLHQHGLEYRNSARLERAPQ